MIPEQALSSVTIESGWRYRVPVRSRPLESFTTDTFGRNFRFWVEAGVLWSQQDGGQPVSELPLPDAVRISACYDQNGRLHVVYNTATSCFFRWYDSQAGGITTTEYPGLVDAHCILDDPREGWNSSSDVVLAYISGGWLRFREQRDRFLMERTPANGQATGLRLIAVAMNDQNRLQFQMFPA